MRMRSHVEFFFISEVYMFTLTRCVERDRERVIFVGFLVIDNIYKIGKYETESYLNLFLFLFEK